jgi:hypothetical protein
MAAIPKTLEELRTAMVSTVESLSLEMGGSSYPGATMESEHKDAEDVVAEFEEAVREDERAKIRDDAEPCYFVPYSTLAPRKK